MESVTFLGPQRFERRLRGVLTELGIDGPVALVTAGWEGRETDTDELVEHLACETVNLRLHERFERTLVGAKEQRLALRARNERLRSLQQLYRLRLAGALGAARELFAREGPASLLEPEREDALRAVANLDAHHHARVVAVQREFWERWHEEPSDELARQMEELESDLEPCRAVLVAGGHVVMLLDRLRAFRLRRQLERRPVVAWSAGAMALTDQVVVFHDSPPQGPGDPEVLDDGLGLVPGVVALPHASARLRLDDPVRVSLFARRFAPARCVCLDQGSRVDWKDEVLRPETGTRELSTSGRVQQMVGDEIRPVKALRDLLRDGPPGDEAIAAFLAGHAFPLVEATKATFVFRGEADSVALQHWIFALPTQQPFVRVEGTDLWHVTLELRRNSRVEYKMLVQWGDRRELLQDALNPFLAHDPFGANSVCQTDGYEVPEWTLPNEATRPGRIEERAVHSKAFDESRTVQVYVPNRLRATRRYPLLVAHDGSDYLRFSSLKAVLDNLIHRLEIPPLIVALLDPGHRLREYADDERHARFVVEELLPGLEKLYPIRTEPSERGLLGASFGGVASLSTAWRYPDRFGKLLLQSGSFAFTDVGTHDRGPVFDPVVDFVNRFRDEPGRPAQRVFLSCGVYERMIYENRSLVPLLQSTGMDVRLVEARDGHNWENWRDRLREGLSWLFPGPLWMVYE